jgi:hypothetical protein
MATTLTDNPNQYCFSENPMIFEIESNLFTGEGPYTPSEDNLFCYVEVWKKTGENPAQDDLLGVKYVPYNRSTKKAYVDISGLVNLAPQLPQINNIIGNPNATLIGSSPDAHCTVYIKYADAFGTPVEYSTLNTSGIYHVIYGYMKWPIPSTFTGTAFSLHAYLSAQATTFAKPVSKSQPDWLYFMVRSAETSFQVQLKLTIYYQDGTDEIITKGPYSIATNYSVHWVACGFMQLELNELSHADTVVSYRVQVMNYPGTVAMFTQDFILEAESEWERYLIIDNGLGGIESVRMYGKATGKINVTRAISKRMSDAFDYKTGEMDTHATSAHQLLDLNSGYYDELYIRHLEQLAVGKLWRIDTTLGFVRLICTSNDLDEVVKDDEVLFALQLTVRDAWDDFSRNQKHLQW